MSQHSISELAPLPSAPLASGSFHPPLEKPAVTPLSSANSYSEDVRQSESTPWYRTTKGLVIILVIVFAVVGIIVGVAAGVTQSNKKGSDGGTTREPNGLTPAGATTSNAGGIVPPRIVTSSIGNGPIPVTTGSLAPLTLNT
jgi:hypothetical protein